jgi:molecular chaperone DnaK (HSP70)
MLKAEEMMDAVESVLQKTAETLSEPERVRITAAQAEVRAAIESKTLTRLQRANAELDNATQHLAAIVIQEAMRERR